MGIILFGLEIFTTLIQRIFCENILEKRMQTRWKELLAWLGYFALFNGLTYSLNGAVWMNLLIFIVTFFVTIRFLYKNPVRTLLGVTIFLYMGGMCSELIVFFGKELLPWTFDEESQLLFIVLSKVVWFCIIKLASLCVKLRRKIELNIQDWMEVFLIPLGSIWILLALFMQEQDGRKVVSFNAVVMVLLINLFTYYLYDKAKENMEKRLRTESLEQQCNYYVRQHKESTEWWEELRQFRHDMKQHYLLEKAYLEAGNYDELSQYCNEILDFVDRKHTVANTGNIYMDSIINYKADVAAKHDIRLVADLKVPRDIEVNAEDLSICLGNLLDNAIEAVSRLEEQKEISLRIYVDGGNLFFLVKNPYEDKPKQKNGRYLTNKTDKKKHGFGLVIVRQIVDKYHGECNIRDNENQFEVEVLLYDFVK